VRKMSSKIRTFCTPMKKCSCGGKLGSAQTIKAKCHGLNGVSDVNAISVQCAKRNCRSRHLPNYCWKANKKINTASVKDIEKQGVLFVSNKRCFTVDYLKLMGALQFRGYLTNDAVEWSMRKVFDQTTQVTYGNDFLTYGNYSALHADASMYWMALQEFEEVRLHKEIEIGKEVSEEALDALDKHLHENVFPPKDPDSVKILVGDGHQKIIAKCGSMGTSKRSGRPKKGKTMKSMQKLKTKKIFNNRTNGWFKLLDPKSSRIVSTVQQFQPERNQIVTDGLTKVLPIYKNCNTFVYDRNCGFAPSAKKDPKLGQIVNYPVEPWHGNKHTKKCKYSLRNNRSYRKLLKGVNCSICEQTFAWFRNYARSLNEMRLLRHKLTVLHYCRLHNENVDKGDIGYLNAPAAMKRRTKKLHKGSYACTKGSCPMKKTKVMKKVKKTVMKGKVVRKR
jgi:hypothetical protein